jgi:vacuolar-type H+-ATPase subunit D/Vma8
MEYIWAPFLAIFWYFVNRLTGKIDEIEKGKAGNSSLGRVADHARELDKRVDALAHTALPRGEFKNDIASLHIRLNEMERNKADKIKNVRVHTPKDKNDNG